VETVDSTRQRWLERLYEVASIGLKFEKWREGPEAQFLLKSLRDDAEKARTACTRISPFTEPGKLADAQVDVRVFETLVLKIDAIISAGAAAEEELTKPEGYPDA